MAAGGAYFSLFILFGGFVAFPIVSAVVILAMRHRAKLSDRIVWGISSVLFPFFLIILGSVLGGLEVVRSHNIMVLFVMSLCVIALFSPFIVLDLFTRRFPKTPR